MLYYLLWALTFFVPATALAYAVERTRDGGLKPPLIIGGLTGAISLLIAIIGLPTYSLTEFTLPFQLIVAGVIVLFIASAWHDSTTPVKGRSITRVSLCFALAAVSFVAYAFITSSGLTNASQLRDTLRHQTDTQFDSAATLLDHDQAHYIDQALATKRAEELTGEQLGLTSRYEFDTFRKQLVDGHLYWVAPLVNRSFFKWFNDGSSPGFAMISASDANNAKLVLGEHAVHYGNQGFYFNSYLKRNLRKNGYASALLGDSVFELRDGDLRPFYVTPIMETTIGYNGHDVIGVIITNAETGEHTKYTPDTIPTWVDRVFSEDLSTAQMDDWGKYIGSWWNAWFIGDNTTSPTEGTQLVLTKKGDLAWYTGITGKNAQDNATMGFILMNTRTGEATFYRSQGLSEIAAASVLKGAVQEKGYMATPPIPYNVAGTNAYVSILKDKSGNRQGFGIVAYSNRNAYAVEATPEEARRAFVRKLLAKGGTSNSIANGQSPTLKTITASVVRATVTQGTLYFLLWHEELGKVIFTHPVNQNPQAALTIAGDDVTIRYVPIDDDSQPVEALINHRLQP
jgi:hypothetical protein